MAAVAESLLRSTFKSFEGLRVQDANASSSATAGAAVHFRDCRSRSVRVVAEKRVIKRKQIILTEDIPTLGKAGQLLSVRAGYFRNYLFPFQKAKPATPKILKAIQLEKEKQEAEKRRIKEEAELIARQFQTVGQFTVRRKGGVGKAIFGSVTTQDVADIIRANTNREVEKKNITLPEIKEVGVYNAEIRLHPEVLAVVKLNVISK